MAKQKYYVVWKGRETGIFYNWDACKVQINGFAGARYKKFDTKQEAEAAYNRPSEEFIGKKKFKTKLSNSQLKEVGNPILESISVDGAWNTATGDAEYQGVYTKTGELVFKNGPFEDGTNNIVEFLAIVHALAHCKKNNSKLPIYSDSRIAIGWVRNKEARTNKIQNEKNKKLFELIDRGIKWLKENKYENKILKWETRGWGENPADFGRK